MQPRHIAKFIVCIALCRWWAAPPSAAGRTRDVQPSPTSDSAAKTLVLDGHVYHDRGVIWNHVTNFGLIGSQPSIPLPYAGAPSARWPGETGVDHLWAAGLWVGGVKQGETAVTTGVYDFELQATDAPLDTIYATAMGAPGGARYPDPLPDDDGDGAEDEDPLNGTDDDGDGLIDEDFAAVGDQHFRCVYSDTPAAILQDYPDHLPLGIAVTQQSFQWDEPAAAGFIGYDFTVTNVWDSALDQVYLGMFADFDIVTWLGGAEDDLAGSWSGEVAVTGGETVPVSVAYMYDGGDYGAGTGYVGFVLCGYTAPESCPAGIVPVVSSCQILSGNTSFENGGDPETDAERYAVLSAGAWDPDIDPLQFADYRVLIASGPFGSLAPGESLTYRVALVAGADLPELLTAAGEAVLTCRGFCYDRNGDPQDGEEFHVPWLRVEDAPVAAAAGSLDAAAAAGGVALRISTTRSGDAEVSLVRRPRDGLAGRTWPREQWQQVGLAGGQAVYSVLDAAPGPWPRTYDLVLKTPDGGLELATTAWGGPPAVPLWFDAAPNPFNPKLTIDYVLAAEGPAALEIFDVRGRMVRSLFAEVRAAGAGSAEWLGEDREGLPAPSGVYLVRLRAGGRTVTREVTLVR